MLKKLLQSFFRKYLFNIALNFWYYSNDCFPYNPVIYSKVFVNKFIPHPCSFFPRYK